MKSRFSIVPFAAAMLAAFAMPVLAHGDTKKDTKVEHNTAHDGRGDDHAAMLGKPGDPTKVSRTIVVEMSDGMRFKPETITVNRGETVKFVVKNVGKVKHEMVLGSMLELKEHAELMRKFPEMEHDDPNQAAALPGKTAEMVWQFSQAGTFDFACLQPGHFEAGMKGTIAVKR